MSSCRPGLKNDPCGVLVWFNGYDWVGSLGVNDLKSDSCHFFVCDSVIVWGTCFVGLSLPRNPWFRFNPMKIGKSASIIWRFTPAKQKVLDAAWKLDFSISLQKFGAFQKLKSDVHLIPLVGANWGRVTMTRRCLEAAQDADSTRCVEIFWESVDGRWNLGKFY